MPDTAAKTIFEETTPYIAANNPLPSASTTPGAIGEKAVFSLDESDADQEESIESVASPDTHAKPEPQSGEEHGEDPATISSSTATTEEPEPEDASQIRIVAGQIVRPFAPPEAEEVPENTGRLRRMLRAIGRLFGR